MKDKPLTIFMARCACRRWAATDINDEKLLWAAVHHVVEKHPYVKAKECISFEIIDTKPKDR